MQEPELKPTRINLMGASIQVVDKATNEVVGGFMMPNRGKAGAFTHRVVRDMAKKGLPGRDLPEHERHRARHQNRLGF